MSRRNPRQQRRAPGVPASPPAVPPAVPPAEDAPSGYLAGHWAEDGGDDRMAFWLPPGVTLDFTISGGEVTHG